MARWRAATDDRDERFMSEALSSRATVLWVTYHDHIPNGQSMIDANVDPYLFDGMRQNTVTTTWELEIKVVAEDPIVLARQ